MHETDDSIEMLGDGAMYASQRSLLVGVFVIVQHPDKEERDLSKRTNDSPAPEP